ncbi:RraA family protein [Paenibacillus nasutitermitis]|uniref:Putative 4-hydroxy-4-methyl-2-oxoglutarate aldolase n=1 Tax=Paenibacillus nasutitermitis TaxID=1652958 RepID=A0A916ZIE3_9BACL|nr:RraA family protein [Paenibacillus nasutitermitis]GGD98419.1 demethylmenaquinone methyltransferase [Paenibacillus nasutitermitis]
MENWTDQQLFALMKEKLYTGVICDSMDDLGYRNQAMDEHIRPLEDGVVVVGRAKTILAADVYHIHENPYEMEIKAMDSIAPDEVVVVCTNKSRNNGIWGELLSTAAKMRGSSGAVIDGLIRDTRQIKKLGFPVYCTGYKPVDSRGRGIVIDYDCVVEVGGIMVHPGDVIFADSDGIAVIPSSQLLQTVQNALDKVERENHTRTELLEGKLLIEVYNKYGVL